MVLLGEENVEVAFNAWEQESCRETADGGSETLVIVPLSQVKEHNFFQVGERKES